MAKRTAGESGLSSTQTAVQAIGAASEEWEWKCGCAARVLNIWDSPQTSAKGTTASTEDMIWGTTGIKLRREEKGRML